MCANLKCTCPSVSVRSIEIFGIWSDTDIHVHTHTSCNTVPLVWGSFRLAPINRHELLTNQILLFNFQAVTTPWLSWAVRPSLTFLECVRWSDLIDIFPTCLAKKFPSGHNKRLPPVLCYSVSWSDIFGIVHWPGRFQPLSTMWRIPFCGPFPSQIKAPWYSKAFNQGHSSI